MTHSRRSIWTSPATGYRLAGVAFLVAGVVFIFTGNTAMWISMFTLGIVFLSLSFTLGRTASDDAAPETEE